MNTENETLTSNQRCPHGISLTANPPCHFCDHQQYVEWASPQLERLGREMADNERLRAALEEIASKGVTTGYGRSALALIARKALSGEPSPVETAAPLPNPFLLKVGPLTGAAQQVPTGEWGVWCNVHGGTLGHVNCPKCASEKAKALRCTCHYDPPGNFVDYCGCPIHTSENGGARQPGDER